MSAGAIGADSVTEPVATGLQLGRLPSATEKRTCRTGEMGITRRHTIPSFENGIPWNCRGPFQCGAQEPWCDSKDLSEINYLGLFLLRISLDVKVSDHDRFTIRNSTIQFGFEHLAAHVRLICAGRRAIALSSAAKLRGQLRLRGLMT
jgi:hypothetical protein